MNFALDRIYRIDRIRKENPDNSVNLMKKTDGTVKSSKRKALLCTNGFERKCMFKDFCTFCTNVQVAHEASKE